MPWGRLPPLVLANDTLDLLGLLLGRTVHHGRVMREQANVALHMSDREHAVFERLQSR
jgi:hypothetical protein